MAKHLKLITNWNELLNSTSYSLPKLKEKLNASVRQLGRQTRQAFGLPFVEWLETQKLKEAKKRLRGAERVKEIATAVGFEHAQNFSLFFIKRTGVSPTQFRRSKSKTGGGAALRS